MNSKSPLPDFKTIPNGARAVHTFSDAEYAARAAKLRALMRDADIDAVLFTSIHNVNYYADFLYCAFGRPYGLVVDAHNAVTISANIDGGQPWRRTVGDNLVYTDWRRDNYFRAVQKIIGNHRVIGVEYDHLNLEIMQKLRTALPKCKFVDISQPTMRLRMIKSDEEIAHIKQGAAVCDIGGAALVDAITDGAPEHEVALASTRAMVREIAKRFPHAELLDTWTWFQSGINTDGAHNPVTSRKVQKGDILSMNCFAMIGGYYIALERTLFYDHVDDASLRLWEINVEVHKAGLQLLRRGARCCDVARELNQLYEAHELLDKRTFGYGHSFGVLCHYYGRETGLELREDIETELAPNMVVSMEPMIMVEHGQPGAGGYREHDIVVITETGADNITGFPFGPEANVVR